MPQHFWLSLSRRNSEPFLALRLLDFLLLLRALLHFLLPLRALLPPTLLFLLLPRTWVLLLWHLLRLNLRLRLTLRHAALIYAWLLLHLALLLPLFLALFSPRLPFLLSLRPLLLALLLCAWLLSLD